MQTAKQISVPMVNKPGRLAKVLAVLSKEKITSRAFSVMDTGSRGTLRFVPEDPDRAATALQAPNIKFEMTEVLLVEVANQTGGIRKICQRLATDHLNIEYVYGSLSSPVGAKRGGLAVIKVNDLAKAQRVLAEAVGNSGPRNNKRPGRRPTYAR